MSSTNTTDISEIIYNYKPSPVLPLIYTAFFGLALVVHLYYLFSKRCRYMIPFVIGVIGEVAGYIFRYLSTKHPLFKGIGGIYGTATQLLIILSPAFLAATHYMIYGRLIRVVGERYSIIRARWVTKIFVTLDILSFMVQATGGSFLSGSSPNVKVGKPVLLIGFMIQIVAFAIYAVFGYHYQRKALRSGEVPGPWVSVLKLLYAGVVIILIRSVYRVIEFGTTNNISGRGYFVDREWWFWVFEATPILICAILFAARHPAQMMDLYAVKGIDGIPNSSSSMEMAIKPEANLEQPLRDPLPWWRRW